MITRFHLAPELLIIDCSIPGACALAEKVAKEVRNVKIVAIVSAVHDCEGCAQRLTGTLLDPDEIAADRIPNCADLVEQLLRKHKHHDGHAATT
jgi:hypothetical protein